MAYLIFPVGLKLSCKLPKETPLFSHPRRISQIDSLSAKQSLSLKAIDSFSKTCNDLSFLRKVSLSPSLLFNLYSLFIGYFIISLFLGFYFFSVLFLSLFIYYYVFWFYVLFLFDSVSSSFFFFKKNYIPFILIMFLCLSFSVPFLFFSFYFLYSFRLSLILFFPTIYFFVQEKLKKGHIIGIIFLKNLYSIVIYIYIFFFKKEKKVFNNINCICIIWVF